MATPFFHVDVQQPAEMRFNRARVRRAFVTIGQRHMRDARRLVMRRARSAPGENPVSDRTPGSFDWLHGAESQ